MKKLALALIFLPIIFIGIKLETLPKNKSAIAIPQQSKKQQIDTQQLKAIVRAESSYGKGFWCFLKKISEIFPKLKKLCYPNK